MSSKIKTSSIDDRISELPDPILSKILSYLPTKESVATSILSSRWKSIFPFDHSKIVIDLSHPEIGDYNYEPPITFIDFVDKLLNQTLRHVPCIDTFILELECRLDEPTIMSWISTLVRLCVREIRLDCYLRDSYALFRRLSGCTKLTRLELKNNWGVGDNRAILFKIKPSIRIPTLRTLDISDYMFEEGEDCNLINCFPGLQEIFMYCCLFEMSNPNIVSHVLKTLSIEDFCLRDDHRPTVNAPNLEMLWLNSCDDDEPHNYCVYPFNSLRLGGADVVKPWYYESVTDLVYDCRKSRHLYLDFSSIKDLTRLSLAYVRQDGWVALAYILNNAPNLEQLKFEEEFEGSYSGFTNFERLVPNPPACLELRIKQVEFRRFDGKVDVIKLLDYFVQNGKVLEKVVLNSVVLPIKR